MRNERIKRAGGDCKAVDKVINKITMRYVAWPHKINRW